MTRIGDTLYTSGQLGVDPLSGKAELDNIEAQTQQALENLKDTLALAGAELGDVVRVTAYLTSMADFAAFNDVYRRYFPDEPPARTTVGVNELARPGLVVELDAIAFAPA